jgi:hypothetical protein
MPLLIADVTHEFRRHKDLVDRAIVGLGDVALFQPPAAHVNPVALIVKHLAGNLWSRWTDFLGSDGEKHHRNRDAEFVLSAGDTPDQLRSDWERGWSALFGTLATLTDDDVERLITIRGEPHRVQQALLRSLDHVAYHTGQILYIARLLNPHGDWLTIPPGGSRSHVAAYLQPPAH